MTKLVTNQCHLIIPGTMHAKNSNTSIQYQTRLQSRNFSTNPPLPANKHLGIQCSAVERNTIPGFLVDIVDIFAVWGRFVGKF